MPTPATLERFIARVESNAHVEAIEEFYTPDSTMQRPTCGIFACPPSRNP